MRAISPIKYSAALTYGKCGKQVCKDNARFRVTVTSIDFGYLKAVERILLVNPEKSNIESPSQSRLLWSDPSYVQAVQGVQGSPNLLGLGPVQSVHSVQYVQSFPYPSLYSTSNPHSTLSLLILSITGIAKGVDRLDVLDATLGTEGML